VDDLSMISTAQVGSPPAAGEVLTGKVNTQWSGADGAFYGLTWFTPGELPTGLTEVVEPGELATVRADLGAPAADRVADRVLFPSPTTGSGFVFGVSQELALPGKRTEYLTTEEQEWSSRTTQLNGEDYEVVLISALKAYRAGRTYDERVNHGMFGPSLPDDGFDGGWAFRAGDDLIVDVPLFGDSAGNGGFSPVTSGGTKVYADGELVGESAAPGGVFAVPAEERDYRVEVTADRGDAFGLSPTVSAEWTFRSAHVDPATLEQVGVSALRFHPKLDAANAAPAGRPFAVPVLLQRNGGATQRADDLTVEVSYDEGKTWRRTPVLLDAVALLNHPADAETVSLRASAADRNGNTVKQTIIRAYHLK
jgi:hypothetical protein